MDEIFYMLRYMSKEKCKIFLTSGFNPNSVTYTVAIT
jgi:hypothetical protein